MPEKVTVLGSIKDVFPESKVKTEGLVHKFHVDELDGEDVEGIYGLIMEHPQYQHLQIKRSGTGLTIIVTEQPVGDLIDN